MNILSFDIEEWSLEKDFFGNDPKKYLEYDRLLDEVLNLLEESEITATFFVLGKIAKDFPYVIKKIVDAGHEVGSHSFAHKWINKINREVFLEDTHSAISAIEDVSGTKVESFRAPAFSIGESNKWAFEVLYSCGIKNDASIFPEVRDFGGFPQFKEQQPCIIEYSGCRINEFPIPIYDIPFLNKGIAFSGGGYFRLLPLKFIASQVKNRSYNMCYFHLADLMKDNIKFMTKSDYELYFEEKGSLSNRILRYIKANVGRSRALDNLKDLIMSTPFSSIRRCISQNSINKIIKI